MSNTHRVSKAYVPVIAFKFSRAWLVLLLLYTLGPLTENVGAGRIVPFVSNGVLIGGGVLAILLICLLFAWFSYLRISWKLEGEEVYITKGIIKRVNKRIPVSKIQSVDMIESIPERMFSVATVKIDTAGGEGDDGKIPCLSKTEAAALRSAIFAIKNGTIMAEEFASEPAVSATSAAPVQRIMEANTMYRMPVKNLIFTGISSSKTILFAFVLIGGISQIFQIFQGTDLYEKLADTLLGLAVPILVALVLVFLVVSWAVSAIGIMINNYGFTVKNAGAKVEIEKGLLEHKTVSIEKNRIQEVRIASGFIRKLIGYAEISVKTATLKVQGDGGNGKNDDVIGLKIIHPFIKISEVDYFIKELLPDFAGAPKVFDALPKRAHFRSVRRYLIWTIASIVICTLTSALIMHFAGGPTYVEFLLGHPLLFIAYIIPTLWAALTGYLAYLGKGLAITDSFISIKSGAYGRTTSIVPRRKIQIAICSSNPFQRMKNLATIKGTTGAHAFLPLMDVEKSTAEDFLEWSIKVK
ncbi:MAG: PH domain-containing protein [Clostridiales Family XIII bacterium]|jgi:putative membrane protein|nr:PH domain-containing protein [Clostridiales Family XIII bacterium]